MNPEFENGRPSNFNEEQHTRMAVELRLAGMPIEAIQHYRTSGSLLGAYRLWFRDGKWKETVMKIHANGYFS